MPDRSYRQPNDEPYLGLFVIGMTGAVDLLRRASDGGFFVEYVCLAASILDAQLRMALVLKHQLDTSGSDIPVELIFQGPDEGYISERGIFKRSFSAGVLSEQQLSAVNSLYDDRNRVIHRYVISRITTKDVFDIAMRYEEMLGEIRAIIRRLEDEQLDRGVGMTVAAGSYDEATMLELANRKHTPDFGVLLRKRRNF